MGVLYFDDSRHPKAGFDLGAFVYAAADPSEEVVDALRRAGLCPGEEEYKSSYHVGRHPEQGAARSELRGLIDRLHIGVVVTPSDEPNTLGPESLILLEKMLKHETVNGTRARAYFDQGLFTSKNAAATMAETRGLTRRCDFEFEENSVTCFGIQLADLVAHTCSTMLLEMLGLVTKTVKAGPNSGYDPDLDVSIGFELWAGLRYRFLWEPPPPIDEWGSDGMQPMADVTPYGLHVAPACSEELRQAALARFGTMYLGCIH